MKIKEETFVKKLWESDHRREAWMISRPYIRSVEEVNMIELNKLDLSVQSLDVIGFHIKSSFYFRELLTSMRPHAIWTQSSRVNPIKDSKISKYATDKLNDYMEKFLSQEFDPSKIDAERMNLPMGTLTEYTIALDFRSWISFLKFLEIYHPKYFAEYGLDILENLRREGFDYETSRINMAFEEVALQPTEGQTSVGPFKFISANIPINMRAQLVRHQDIKIVDKFMFWNEDEVELMPQNKFIHVNLLVSENKWKQIMSHRRCWIANFELYECFHAIASVDEYLDSLPCKCDYKNCPFKMDNDSRKKGDDPNTPCPLSFEEYEDAEKSIIDRTIALGKSSGLKAFTELVYKKWSTAE